MGIALVLSKVLKAVVFTAHCNTDPTRVEHLLAPTSNMRAKDDKRNQKDIKKMTKRQPNRTDVHMWRLQRAAI
jgi:hypothetical protein